MGITSYRWVHRVDTSGLGRTTVRRIERRFLLFNGSELVATQGRTSASVAVGQGIIGFGVVTVGVIATLATVLGFFGSTWWLFDYAANFRAHLAVILVIVALIYAMLFSKATGVFFLAIAAINALTILPLYTNSPEPAVGSDTLTVASFSVDQRYSIKGTTYRWAESLDADVVVLLETTSDWETDDVESDYQSETLIPADRTYGFTILTRDGVEAELLRVGRLRDSVLRVEAAIGDQPVAIYAVSARPSSNETDAGDRDAYLAEVGRMVNTETIPTVIVGNMEATPWSHAFRDLVASSELINSLDGFRIQATWPADQWAFFRMPIDHLLHTDELTTIDRNLGPTFGVDHRPIVVKLGNSS